MKLQIQMPDELYEHFTIQAEQVAGAGKPVDVTALLVDRLTRFSQVAPTDRVVVIDSKSRQELEAILGGGSLKDPADLISKVKKLASIEFGVYRFDFTPAQLAELKNYANRNRLSIEEACKRAFKRMEEMFFDHVGG